MSGRHGQLRMGKNEAHVVFLTDAIIQPGYRGKSGDCPHPSV